jgi:hypothetical protein
LACEVRYENFRIVYLKKFPFGIHFKYDEKKNLIEIYSVFHTSRDPEIWKDRK